ncbi:hypothetical protein K1T71_006145 [Dendrolimus kikuchii]|uniref:Uncharacterized protein n=1 Tax=Dendrolimus kikuchii TaxID=765133 RepID=A0ACC1D3A3_9NEOP|nr:hypothetical protein K1T71_006145 [Dendrolimus kikuchii]
MFYKLLTIFALVAVAFASPKPAPEPQVAFVGAGSVPLAYSAYSAYPVPGAYPYAGYPYSNYGYPVLVR